MKQTFKVEIEHNYTSPITVEGVKDQFGDGEGFAWITSVTELPEPAQDKCVWNEESDYDSDTIWTTPCGNIQKFNLGTPEENKYKYCPYCGKPIEVKDGK